MKSSWIYNPIILSLFVWFVWRSFLQFVDVQHILNLFLFKFTLNYVNYDGISSVSSILSESSFSSGKKEGEVSSSVDPSCSYLVPSVSSVSFSFFSKDGVTVFCLNSRYIGRSLLFLRWIPLVPI